MPAESAPEPTVILDAASSAASGQPLEMERHPVEPDRQVKLETELAWLTQEPAAARALVAALFPEGVPLDASLYDRLSRFRFFLGFAGPIEAIVAAAWIAMLRTLDERDQQTALGTFTQTGHAFFTLHDGLADVVTAIRYRPPSRRIGFRLS